MEAGPISWFLSEDEKIAGLTNTNKEPGLRLFLALHQLTLLRN